jgi:hypothetical protein
VGGVVLSGGRREDCPLGPLAPQPPQRGVTRDRDEHDEYQAGDETQIVRQSKTVDPILVAKEKAQVVKKNGLLEIVETKEDLDSIGGLDVLKEWLLRGS